MTESVLKKLIDEVLSESDERKRLSILDSCLEMVKGVSLSSYENHRAMIQHAISQFERLTDVGVAFLFSRSWALLQEVLPLLSEKPSPVKGYINISCEQDEREQLFHQAVGSLEKEHVIIEKNQNLLKNLNLEERRKLANEIVHLIQYAGLHTSWTQDDINLFLLLCNIVYNISLEDGIIDLYIFFVQNFIDRLNTSGHFQDARDLAESVIMAGFEENFIGLAHLAASRAYCGSNDIVGGLLMMILSLEEIKNNSREINQVVSFDLLWQFLKITRSVGVLRPEIVNPLKSAVKKLQIDDYKWLSFHNTLFGARLTFGENILSEYADFLTENREAFYATLDHSAMPFYTMLQAARSIFPNADYSPFTHYERAVMSVIQQNGNEPIIDFYERNNIAERLKEQLLKLNENRSADDYAKNSHFSMLLARQLLDEASRESQFANFLLAMHVRADYTFIYPETYITSPFRLIEPKDVIADDFKMIVSETSQYKQLSGTNQGDLTLWIGRGESQFQMLRVISEMHSTATLNGFPTVTETKHACENISKLRFERCIKKPNESIYEKSVQDYEFEYSDLLHILKGFHIPLPNIATRLLIVKDKDLACYPHHLLIDERTGQFVGEHLPSANIVSTEVLLDTRDQNIMHRDFSRSFWIPIESGEFTFETILGNIGQILCKHNFTINKSFVPNEPLSSDLNIVCAHGGSDINTTEWFYANEKPIRQSDAVVGNGKLLVLLVCHAGSMSTQITDSAIHTTIKRFLRKGYCSVVAPMWSLSTEILPVWLGRFMEELEAGNYVIDAVYRANGAVRNKYPAPAAWACLHLFGNPYLCITDDEQ